MTISEEQLQEWEALVASYEQAHVAETAYTFKKAIPALIAELREARADMTVYKGMADNYWKDRCAIAETNLAEAQASEKEIRIAVEFVLKEFQASEAAGYRSRDRLFCIEILSKALEGQQYQSALTAAIDTAVAPHLQKLAELESKIEFQNNELVEKQQYILSLERKLSAWGQNVAKLDAVMLEFCPDEMTDEQLAAWGEAQERVPDGGIESLTQEGEK